MNANMIQDLQVSTLNINIEYEYLSNHHILNRLDYEQPFFSYSKGL